VGVAVGFRRGRLKSIYQVLRGKDMETGKFSAQRRDEQFRVLRGAQAQVLDLTHWHEFLKCLLAAGYRSDELVGSETALVYSYAFFLIGLAQHEIPLQSLRPLISRFFFAASLASRYTASSESTMEDDLSRVSRAKDAAALAATLEGIISGMLTGDFWNITLPNELETSSSRNPAFLAFVAAQVRLDAPVLFSCDGMRVSALFDPALKPRKKALERHHLFPKKWLKTRGVEDQKLTNQVANYAVLEWPVNAGIGGDEPPSGYVPKVRARIAPDLWPAMCAGHALPDGWETMEYCGFLAARRVLMAGLIRRGFEALG